MKVARLRDAPRGEPVGGKRQGETLEEEGRRGDMCQLISLDTMELDAMITRWTSCEAYFICHTTTTHYFGTVLWLHLTICVQMCAGIL